MRCILRAIASGGLLAILAAVAVAAAENSNDAGSASMQTYQEQLDFFNEHWPAMAAAAESSGSAGVIEFISGFDSDLEKRVLYMFARQGLGNDEWEAKSLDLLIEVADAGIAEFMRQADAETEKEERNKRIDGANVISFNLAADLADCWPGDDFPREQRHFERGLRAGAECLMWREMLGKPAGPFSMAFWVHGMHALSLGDAEQAVSSFQSSLEYAQQAATEAGAVSEVGPQSTFGVILGAGYLGLARWAAGENNGREQYEAALASFTAQLEDEAKKDDAQFGIDQLQTVKSRYVN